MKLFERILSFCVAVFLVLNLVYLFKLHAALGDLQRRYDELQPSIEEASRLIRQLNKFGDFFSPREEREDPLDRVARKLERYLGGGEEADASDPAAEAPPPDPGAVFDEYIKRIEASAYTYYWDGRPFRAVNMGAQLRRKFPEELKQTQDIATLERRLFHTYDAATGSYGPAYEVEIDGVRRNLYTWLTGKPGLN